MKIGFFITARLKSSRLKRKILLDLNGKTVLDRVIERAKKVKGIDGIVLCTSTHPQDTELLKNAEINKIDSFRGSEDDVLNRLLGAAKKYNYDAFVSITADNPLFSICTTDTIVQMYRDKKYDFIYTKGIPIGCGTYMVDVKALEVVNFMKQQSDTEIWGPYINRPDFFNVAELNIKDSFFNDKLRITLDYPEDYEFFKKIHEYFNINDIPSLINVFDVLNANPNILKINESRKQFFLPEKVIDKINKEFDKRKDQAIIFAKKINKELNPSFTSRNKYLY